MRARRREGPQAQNADSLLDTMANVVGILVVLMAVTQLTVNDAMKRIKTWESEEAVSLREAEREARTQLAAIGGIDLERTLEIARLREHIEQLRGQPEASAKRDKAAVATDVASQRMRARRLEDSIHAKEQKLASLQILLSEAEARAEKEHVEVRLPDPRPAPPTAGELKVFCRKGRVFDPRFVGNELLRWRMLDDAGYPVARLEWRSDTIGETLAQLRSPDAQFRKLLDEVDSQSRFLRFYVWEDSFEVYLEARRLAEEAGFAAGWQPLPNGRPLDLVQGPGNPTPVD